MLSALPCPADGTQLRIHNPHNARCPTCHTDYIITITDARPPTRFNRNAPFAALVEQIDGLASINQYGRRTIPTHADLDPHRKVAV